jgi:hypothetical protein
VFLASKSAEPKILQGLHPYSKRIDDVEPFWKHVFLSRFMPIAKVLLLDFTCKSKALDPKGVNVLSASTSQMPANFSWVWKQNSR